MRADPALDDAPHAGAFLRADAPSLYEHVMGRRFDRLAPALREFHRLAGRVLLRGEVEVAAPRGVLARWLAAMLGTPRQAGAGPIRFEIDASPAAETWTRHFADRTMVSRMSCGAGACIVERLGPATLVFHLDESEQCLVMSLQAMHFFGLRCPGWLAPRIVARERAAGSRIHFDVSARVPGIGHVTGYRGWLDLASADRLDR